MSRKLWLICALLTVIALFGPAQDASQAPQPHLADTIALPPAGTVLVVAPHPDDAVLGAGGLITAARQAGLDVYVVYVTCGDAFGKALQALKPDDTELTSDDYLELGRLRAHEALAALSMLKVTHSVFLGFPDRGIAYLWLSPGDSRPYLSPSTQRAAVPYSLALRPGTPYTANMLLFELSQVIERRRPELIVLPDTDDNHGDHWAAGAFTLAAVGRVMPRHAGYRPTLYGYTIHLRNGKQTANHQTGEVTFPLTTSQRAAKARALHAHQSQLRVRRDFLESLVRSSEPFVRLNPVLTGQACNDDNLPLSQIRPICVHRVGGGLVILMTRNTQVASIRDIYRLSIVPLSGGTLYPPRWHYEVRAASGRQVDPSNAVNSPELTTTARTIKMRLRSVTSRERYALVTLQTARGDATEILVPWTLVDLGEN